MIEKTMEVYVDDMITKSIDPTNYMSHLREAFEVLQENYMKLNLEKCTFWVKSWKFMGFLVSQRGIEANLKKIGDHP